MVSLVHIQLAEYFGSAKLHFHIFHSKWFCHWLWYCHVWSPHVGTKSCFAIFLGGNNWICAPGSWNFIWDSFQYSHCKESLFLFFDLFLQVIQNSGFCTMGSTVLSMRNFALMDLCLPNLVNTSGYAFLTLFDSSSSLVCSVRLAMWMTSSAIPVSNESKGFELACFWASSMNSALVCMFVERLLIGASAIGSDR